MRRLVTSLAISLALTLVAPFSWSAAATTRASEVTLRLVSQTPWLNADHPNLRIQVRATNRSSAMVSDLSLSVTLLSPVRSRTAYEQSLSNDPEGSSTLLTPPPFTIRGPLRPGESRALDPGPIDLSFLNGFPSFVYPLRVELRSQFAPLATLRTPIVFLNLPPGHARADTPLTMSWSFVLHSPVLRGADGTFDAAAVKALLEPFGTLRGEVDALAALVASRRPAPVDVVVPPLLLAQLERLRAGFAVNEGSAVRKVLAGTGDALVAGQVLDRLRTVLRSPSVEVSALPYAAPNIPALLSAGLDGDLESQIVAGREEIRRVVGVDPMPNLLRPVGSYLDQQSLVRLSHDGFDLFLVGPSTVLRPPQENEFAQPATAALEVGPEPGETVTAVVPDPGIDRLLSSDIPSTDPRLAAQAVLGELAQIWLERPGVARSVALAFTEETAIPGRVFGPLVREAGSAPWLSLRSLSVMATRFPPPDQPATLVPKVGTMFPAWYVNLLNRAHGALANYRSMVPGSTVLPSELESTLLTAESADFASSERSGAGYVASVRGRLQSEFRKVGLETSPVITLTSRGGVIPVGITSQTGYPIHVEVKLVSNHLSIPSDFQEVQVGGSSKPLLFHVRAKTTGRFPVQVEIRTPSGYALDTAQLVVRSTAYNLVALLITIGAAAFLLLGWARRFLPRKTA